MAAINLTPDSFYEPSRVEADNIVDRINRLLDAGARIIDIGAVSTRPGADPVSIQAEWERLEPALKKIAAMPVIPRISIDTTSSVIVERCLDILGNVIVNDISAGEDDPWMLPLCAKHRLSFVAMHKRGNPQTMDALTLYPDGVMNELLRFFGNFSKKAQTAGLDDWILDPGLGFAKTAEQCWEILENLAMLKRFGRPILVGVSDKRFTGGDNERAERLALAGGASILRRHVRV